jgi:hypothetical protein
MATSAELKDARSRAFDRSLKRGDVQVSVRPDVKSAERHSTIA